MAKTAVIYMCEHCLEASKTIIPDSSLLRNEVFVKYLTTCGSCGQEMIRRFGSLKEAEWEMQHMAKVREL